MNKSSNCGGCPNQGSEICDTCVWNTSFATLTDNCVPRNTTATDPIPEYEETLKELIIRLIAELRQDIYLMRKEFRLDRLANYSYEECEGK